MAVQTGLWVFAGILLFAILGLILAVRRRSSKGEEILASLRDNFPFEKYVGLFGPLHWDSWLRLVEQEPVAHAELQALVQKAKADTRMGEQAPVLGEIAACVRRHPPLKRRVEVEYKIQIAHMLRQVLFRKVPHPEVKKAEWKTVYERLQAILPREPDKAGGVHLVSYEVDEPGHKIELSNPDLLTKEFLDAIQKTLSGLRNTWYVILQLDFDRIHPDAMPAMLTVWADHVDEAWDKDQLRSVLGTRFRL